MSDIEEVSAGYLNLRRQLAEARAEVEIYQKTIDDNAAYVMELVAENNSLLAKYDDMFNYSEGFLVDLCATLDLDYTLETQATVIEKVEALKGQLAALRPALRSWRSSE